METLTAAEAKLDQLKREFPHWSIIHTCDARRWWANRGPLCDERGRSCVDADTADGLREILRRLDA